MAEQPVPEGAAIAARPESLEGDAAVRASDRAVNNTTPLDAGRLRDDRSAHADRHHLEQRFAGHVMLFAVERGRDGREQIAIETGFAGARAQVKAERCNVAPGELRPPREAMIGREGNEQTFLP
jgi:hypothetical protein